MPLLIPAVGYGVRLDVQCDESAGAQACAASLLLDFAAWTQLSATAGNLPRVSLRLHSSPYPRTREWAYQRLFRTKMCQAHGLGPVRVNVYDDQSAVQLDGRDPRHLTAVIHSPDADLLYEIAYSAGLALVGEQLDSQGLHRVHALGFSALGTNVLCVLGERGGKSTLAMALKLGGSGVRFFSDETPLLSRHGMIPYPNRLALLPDALELLGHKATAGGRPFRRRHFPLKYLYSWKSTEVAIPGKINALLVNGGCAAAEPEITACSRSHGLSALAHSMVLGLGVAQMAEFLLRLNPTQLLRLGSFGASRSTVALAVVRSAPVYVFRRSADPFSNARALLSFLATIRPNSSIHNGQG